MSAKSAGGTVVGEETRRSISSIAVRGLQGKFDYVVDVAPLRARAGKDLPPRLAAVTENRLTLLYGKNGTGKTTLLRLLFHALSPAGDRGHRTAVAAIRFRELLIEMTDGSRVRYWREAAAEIGSFLVEISLKGRSPIRATRWSDDWDELRRAKRRILFHDGTQTSFEFEDAGLFEGAIGANDLGERAFVDALAELGVNPVFLEDSRAITSDALGEEDVMRARAVARARRHSRGEDDDAPVRRGEVDIEEAIERVRMYLTQLAFAGTKIGSARVDTVYVNFAEAIIEHSSTVGRPNRSLVPDLRTKVHNLNERADRFRRYGLLSESPMLELEERLVHAEYKHGPVLTQVLTPHLDGFAERLDALEPGLAAVAALVDALNSFLSGKRVDFVPDRTGLTITDERTQETIPPEQLSSGEKQIVLMFSDIIALQDVTRLFLIDEPELSLNPDWQRVLMPSLLGVTEASGMQLIAATHSIEIMARYRDRRRRLPG